MATIEELENHIAYLEKCNDQLNEVNKELLERLNNNFAYLRELEAKVYGGTTK